ncbi:MAG: death-on-curing protein [Thermodesulfovibrionales bacterium]
MNIRKSAKENKLSNSQILVYQAETGQLTTDVRLENETVWLTQKLMAELFQTSEPNINMHVNNMFEEGELELDPVIKEFLTTAADGIWRS